MFKLFHLLNLSTTIELNDVHTPEVSSINLGLFLSLTKFQAMGARVLIKP